MEHGTDTDQREYFRIDDEVYLKCKVVPEEMLAQQPLDGIQHDTVDAGNLGLKLQALASQSGNILAGIRKSQPEIAQYLALLDKRIELIARTVVGEQLGEALKPNTRVNLSAGGLAFPSPKALQNGTLLLVDLMLFPSHLHIQAYARVIHSEQKSEEGPHPYCVGVDFEQISGIAREALVKHTLEIQSARLRRERRKE